MEHTYALLLILPWCASAVCATENIADTGTRIHHMSIGIIVEKDSREDHECSGISSMTFDLNGGMIINATTVAIPIDHLHTFSAFATVQQQQLKNNYDFLLLGESVQLAQRHNTTFFAVDGSHDDKIQKIVTQKIQTQCPIQIFIQDVGIPRKLFQALLSALNWKAVILLTDPDSVDLLGHIFDIMSQIDVKVLHVSFSPNATDLVLLEQIHDAYLSMIRGQMNFLVVCQYRCIERVIRLANGFDEIYNGETALYMHSRWVVMAPENNITALINLGKNLINLAVIETSTDSNPCGNCYYQACLLSPNLPVIYKIWTSMWSANEDRYAYLTATYDSMNETLHYDADLFPNARFGFNRKKFVISTNMAGEDFLYRFTTEMTCSITEPVISVWPPYVYKRVSEDGRVYYEGITIELLKEVAKSLNFSYQLTESPDGEWGVIALDGSWTGLVGQLERKEIFAVFAPLGITSFRDVVMDFTTPYYYDYYVVLMRLPDPSESKWRILLTIFSWPVLLCLISSLPIMSLILWYLERVNPYYTYMYKASAKLNPLNRFINSFWYLYGALMNQGGIHLPKSWAGRTIVIFWWLYSIMMMVTYSGNLIAFLAVNKQNAPFNTLAEMTAQNTYTWGTISGGFLVDLLKTSNRTDFREMWLGIQRFLADDNPEALTPNHTRQQEMMVTTRYAYISDKSGIADIMAKMCDLILIREEFFPTNYGVGLQNNSPYLEMFNREVMRVQESGLIQIWRQKWWPKKDFCSVPQNTAGTVQLLDVQGVFYLLAVGVVLGLNVLTIEHVLKRYWQKEH